jgi:hypothetical protein
MFVVHTFMCLQINCIYSHQQLHAIMQTNIDTLLYFFQPWIQFLTGLQYVSSGVGSDESLHFALHIAEKKKRSFVEILQNFLCRMEYSQSSYLASFYCGLIAHTIFYCN